MTLLLAEALTANHGQLQAVRGVSLSVEPGETIALVGANGAGKTTMLRTIAGAHPLAGGHLRFKGRDLAGTAAHQRAAMGLALVPEGRRLFSRLTVEENLELATSAGRRGAWTLDAVMETFPNLKARRRSLAGALSGGEQQATAIGRALMMNPRASASRRGVPGAFAARCRSCLQGARQAESLGRRDRPGRAGSQPRHGDGEPHDVHAGRPDRHRGADFHVDERPSDTGLLRSQRREQGAGAGVILLNQIVQGVLLGGYYAVIACGVVVHVQRYADHQPRAWWACGDRGLWTLCSGRSVRRQSVPRPCRCRSRHGSGRARAAEVRVGAERARRPAGAGSLDFRTLDHHRQSAVRGLRRRHAFARALYRRSLVRQLVVERPDRHRQAGCADPRHGDCDDRRHPVFFSSAL